MKILIKLIQAHLINIFFLLTETNSQI